MDSNGDSFVTFAVVLYIYDAEGEPPILFERQVLILEVLLRSLLCSEYRE
mgnify:CR=1